jgi:hypothetical protein
MNAKDDVIGTLWVCILCFFTWLCKEIAEIDYFKSFIGVSLTIIIFLIARKK